jgi:hypothetical protein
VVGSLDRDLHITLPSGQSARNMSCDARLEDEINHQIVPDNLLLLFQCTQSLIKPYPSNLACRICSPQTASSLPPLSSRSS